MNDARGSLRSKPKPAGGGVIADPLRQFTTQPGASRSSRWRTIWGPPSRERQAICPSKTGSRMGVWPAGAP